MTPITQTDPRELLIQELDTARAGLLKALRELTEDEEIYPRWKLKHFLAHVTGWDEAVTASLNAYVQGESAAMASYRGIDEYNAHSVETRIDLSLPQIERELVFAREELKKAIRAVPLDQYPGELVFPWGERGPVTGVVGVLIHHEHGHSAELAEHKAEPKTDEV